MPGAGGRGPGDRRFPCRVGDRPRRYGGRVPRPPVLPERKVALKLLSPDLASDPAFRERFVHESNAAASTEHPNIVPVYGAGEADGQLYLAMRFIEGTDFGSLLAREGALRPIAPAGSAPRSRTRSRPRTTGD